MKITKTNDIETIKYKIKDLECDLTEQIKLEQESYDKMDAKYTKKVLRENAIHRAKLTMGVQAAEEIYKNFWNAREIPNYVPGGRALMQLDPLGGHSTMSYQLILIRFDGVVNTYSIPWKLFQICWAYINDKDKLVHSQIPNGREEYAKALRELGFTYDKKEIDKVQMKTNIQLPNFGHLMGFNGSIDSVLELELLSTNEDKKPGTYTKLMYSGIDKAFQWSSTVLLTDTLITAFANEYGVIQDKLEKKLAKDNAKNKKTKKETK